MAGRYYVDTSAYLALLLGEAGSEILVAELDGQRLVSSAILVLEAKRNLIRHAREGKLEPHHLQDALDRVKRDLDAFVLRDLTLDLCESAEMPVVSTPRSLDLAHLRTASWFHRQEPLERFVSLDAAQVQAARELGLPV